jgi:hypothetical protein
MKRPKKWMTESPSSMKVSDIYHPRCLLEDSMINSSLHLTCGYNELTMTSGLTFRRFANVCYKFDASTQYLTANRIKAHLMIRDIPGFCTLKVFDHELALLNFHP